MSEKLKVTELRKIVFAEMNVAAYRQRVFADLLAELDGRVEEKAEEVADVVETKAAPKTKSKSKPVAQVEETPEVEETEDDMFGEEKEEDQGPTLEDVRKVVKDFATKFGKDKALQLLGKFKVTNIPDIKKADYSKVIELANKHLKK